MEKVIIKDYLEKHGILYIVATPIGNLEDITLRALRILKEVDMILCEDTRMTKRLCEKYDIRTPLMSYHAHSGLTKVDTIFERLKEGKILALVSDAGTPTISDPGVLLIQQIKKEFGDQVTIVPIPGPSALVAALSASGLSAPTFTFLGFLPHKKGRETLFKDIAGSKRAVVFYESPHRIEKTLTSLEKVLSPSRQVVIARELTKIHEEFIVGSVQDVLTRLLRSDTVRGEFVVMIEGGK